MKIFVLVCSVVWSFGGEYPSTPQSYIVDSPEMASLIIWQDGKSNNLMVEPDRSKKWTLYEVNFETKAVKEVPIPTMTFTKEILKEEALRTCVRWSEGQDCVSSD